VVVSVLMGCKLASRETGLVDRQRYYKRHGDVKGLIHGRLDRGLRPEGDHAYEAFIYLRI
jgi:hypothetical protein